MTYITTIETQINGESVTLGVTHFERHEGNGSMYSAATDLDYYGWTECYYDILDEEGRKLAIEPSEKDLDRLHCLIAETL
jgi:hypothetical protein